MSSDVRILFVDDEPMDILIEQTELTRSGISFAARIAASETEMADALTTFKPDLVLCDYLIPGFSGPHALDTVRRVRPSTPILMVSGEIPDDTAVECLNWGALDYILKSDLQRLAPAVRRVLEDPQRRRLPLVGAEESAHIDAVTGLPLLAVLRPAILAAFEAADAQAVSALAVITLDRFRRVVERFGRPAADDVLRDLGSLLQGQAGTLQWAARTGPDEFVLALSDLLDAHAASAAIQALLASIATPRQIEGQRVCVSASAGVALFPADGRNLEELLSKATAARLEIKHRAHGTMRFHSGDVEQHALARTRLRQGLEQAIEREELTLNYQPQFDIASGRVCGVEALARWYPPEAPRIAPSVFIPLAEESGLIEALGSWALRTGCRASASWRQGRPPMPPLSVNVSARQVRPAFTREIAAALAGTGLEPHQLELEITDSVLLANVDAALACLWQWKSLGVRIALDDFGVGHGNFGYLTRLPLDRLKIDGSVTRAMTRGSQESSLVRAVIALGHELGFTVLAEGVETLEQLSLLHEVGCEQAQGYLLARPAGAAETRQSMAQRWGGAIKDLGASRSLQ